MGVVSVKATYLCGSLVLIGITATGCVHRSPYLDERLGSAVSTTTVQQTLVPPVSAAGEPVEGVDGRAAREAIVNYHESFKQPPPPTQVFNFGIGAQGASPQ